MLTSLAQKIASTLSALRSCQKSGNTEWEDKHEAALEKMLENMPSGSGFDAGTKLDMDKSTYTKLVFHTSFHHMDANGYYDGWTEHTVKVTPCFEGFGITVSGRNRNQIKDYVADTFHHILSEKTAI